MKLNLGCGKDIRQGYINVDMRPGLGVDEVADLSKFPWFYKDESVDEIVMLDFLEHFPYKKTLPILEECWRILKVGANIMVQVPDFEHCAMAVLDDPDLAFQCNRCGWWFESGRALNNNCMKCGQEYSDIQDAAIHRLFGGQDYEGNFHYTAFTENILFRFLIKTGFENIEFIEKNQNGETYEQNWNICARARKKGDVW